MANYNKVLLMGNLTRDVELRYTNNNTAIGKIGLAVNRRYRSGEGNELREETTFVDCEAWGRTAEVMSQYLKKGRPVFIEGRLKLDQWEDQEGKKRSKLLVVVDRFEFVDSRGGDGGGGSGQGAPRSVGAAAGSGPDSGGHQPISEDDIPF